MELRVTKSKPRPGRSPLWSGLDWGKTRRAAGLCRICNTPTMANSGSSCELHWFVNLSCKRLGTSKHAAALKEKLVSQGYRCPYTGAHLVIGVNASLDHIKPICRFPALKNDISNVEWVLTSINYAKRNLTHDEFIDLCKLVAARGEP